MRLIPGVQQDCTGFKYQIGLEDDGTQVRVPYTEIGKVEYISGSMAKLTDFFVVTEIDGSQRRL